MRERDSELRERKRMMIVALGVCYICTNLQVACLLQRRGQREMRRAPLSS